uniref:Uncharacterized protein n=1 Tax=Gopherus agassizii TaxID=38772 RepID=A0A452HNH1_9SAUR
MCVKHCQCHCKDTCCTQLILLLFTEPQEGSLAGGTWITLTLDGLTSPQLQFMYSTSGSLLEVSLVSPILPPVRCDVHPVYFDVSIIRCKTRYDTLLKRFRKDFLGRRCPRKTCEDVFLLFSECVLASMTPKLSVTLLSARQYQEINQGRCSISVCYRSGINHTESNAFT